MLKLWLAMLKESFPHLQFAFTILPEEEKIFFPLLLTQIKD